MLEAVLRGLRVPGTTRQLPSWNWNWMKLVGFNPDHCLANPRTEPEVQAGKNQAKEPRKHRN